MLFNTCLFTLFLISLSHFVFEQGFPSRLPFSLVIFRRPQSVWRHAVQYCLIHFCSMSIQCRKLWFCYVFVYISSFCSYQNVDVWYIGFLFFTYVVFFLHRQNIYIIGLGQGIKLVGSKIHWYVSIWWRHLKIKIKVVHSAVMRFTVYNTIIIYSKVANKGALLVCKPLSVLTTVFEFNVSRKGFSSF